MFNYKKNIFYLCLILILKLTPFTLDAQSNTIIKGKILSNKVKVAKINYFSSIFANNEIIASSSVKPDSTFTIKFQLSSPKLLRLFNTNIWVSPGDSVYIVSGGDKGITLAEGRNKGNYLFYSNYERYLNRTRTSRNYCDTLDRYFIEIVKKKEEDYQFLTDFKKNNEISYLFNQHLKLKFQYDYLIKKIEPYIWCSEIPSTDLVINPEKFSNEDAFVTNHYITALKFYFYYLTGSKLRSKKKYSLKKIWKDWGILDTNFKGRNRDVLRLIFLRELPKRDSLKPTIDSFLQIARDDLTYPKYEEKLDFIYSTYHIVNKPLSNQITNSTLKDRLENELYFNDILSHHRGKVVLIDFWANWCKPCKEEIPFIETLSKQIDTSKFTVVYLSIDKDIDNWKEALKKQSNKSNHYLVGGDFYHPIINFFLPSILPRYVILNKKKNLAVYNAPRPSKGQALYDIIVKIIQEENTKIQESER